MTYVALLRGINVGGITRVEMPRLKQTFERLGLQDVKTYINSGNVIFETEKADEITLAKRLEGAIEQEFGFTVPTLVRSQGEIAQLVKGIPPTWVNDKTMKCDVMFLWADIDTPDILKQIPHNPEIEDVIYLPGAVVWRIDRDKVSRGKVLRIIGTDMHQKLTVRNPNTVRKLLDLMSSKN